MKAEEYSNIHLQNQKERVLAIILDGPQSQDQDILPYAPDSKEGAQIYAAFSDDELLDLLRKVSHELGHSPSQGEVHGILRAYLKHRFKHWPGALRAAGLSRSAGRGGMSAEQVAEKHQAHQQMLDQVRDMAQQLGRMPHPSELPEVCQSLKKWHRTWGEVLAAAGVEDAVATGLQKEDHFEADVLGMLQELRALAEHLNRAPLRSEVEPSLRQALIQRFGSWRNALYQIDLEPVQRITPFVNAPLKRGKGGQRATHRQELYDCHYRLLKLDPQTSEDLELVRQLAQQLGHTPGRRDVPPEVRRRLQQACGSWSNALYQLGLQREERCR